MVKQPLLQLVVSLIMVRGCAASGVPAKHEWAAEIKGLHGVSAAMLSCAELLAVSISWILCCNNLTLFLPVPGAESYSSIVLCILASRLVKVHSFEEGLFLTNCPR